MVKTLSAIISFILIVLAAIGSLFQGIPSGAPGGSENHVPAASEEDLLGIWYEQEDFGGTLEITESKIIYTWESYSGGEYSTDADYTLKDTGKRILIETEEEDYFFYVDMYYDKEQDIVAGYTMPVLDGDGGYKYTEFLRTEYVAPPPPEYPPAEDKSDPDAKKTFDDLTIYHLKASFYDPGPYHDPYSSMAQEPPYPDHYSYDLTVQKDGSALCSSSFCQEIELSKEIVDKLQELVRENDLGSINGIIIHTPDLPYDSPDYELELELANGESIYSSANGSDVPENWSSFQESMHYLLFFAFVDAGYQLNGEFHSTKPMKRIGIPEEERVMPDIQKDSVRIEPDWEKSYDFDQHADYFIFTGDSEKYPALMQTLDGLSEKYKTLAEEDLQKDFDTMEQVPESVWREAERRYIYSFYAVEYMKCSGPIFSFFLSEGHANSLGVGEHGYGDYPDYYFNIDMESGKIIPFSDLFTDIDTACDVVCETMSSSYGDHREIGRFIHSDEFPERLREYIDKPAPDGISWHADYDSVTVLFPAELFPMEDYIIMETFYYDEMQEELSDTYTSVW